MRQTRVENFFAYSRPPKPPPTGRSFLDLPLAVRKQVYVYAQVTDHEFDLNFANLEFWAKRKYPDQFYRTHLFCYHNGSTVFKLRDVSDGNIWELGKDDPEYDVNDYSEYECCINHIFNLLMTCKQVHKEVEELAYGANLFQICRGNPYGFERFWNLSHNAVAALTTLTVRLEKSRTRVRTDSFMSDSAIPSPIDLTLPLGRRILQDWKALLARLVQLSRPNALRLQLIFCAANIESAKALLEPMKYLPLLKNCSIWGSLGQKKGVSILHVSPVSLNLCAIRTDSKQSSNKYHAMSSLQAQYRDGYNADLSRLIHDTIRNLTTPATDTQPTFRYLDLPKELRLQIISHTTLGARSRTEWRPRSMKRNCKCASHKIASDAQANDCEADFCIDGFGPTGPDSITKIAPLDDPLCCGRCQPKEYEGACFCRLSGYIFSSSCRCDGMRQALFATSRQVREDAITTFYSRKRVRVNPYNTPLRNTTGDWPPMAMIGLNKVELSLYISSLSRSALYHIRSLKWVLPISDEKYLSPNGPAFKNYLDTVEVMEEAMNLPALTLTIDMIQCGYYDRASYHKPIALRRLKPLTKDLIKFYSQVIAPFVELGDAGLKNFFVHVEYGWTKGTPLPSYIEQRLERVVMGPDYDSEDRGKKDPKSRRFVLR
jgi:hypothetical protein